jgi:hypothetical protein
MLRYNGAVIGGIFDAKQKPLSFCRLPVMGRDSATDGRASRALSFLGQIGLMGTLVYGWGKG